MWRHRVQILPCKPGQLSSEQSTGVGQAWAPHTRRATVVPAQELPCENADHSAGHVGGALCRTLLQARAE